MTLLDKIDIGLFVWTNLMCAITIFIWWRYG